MPLFHTPLYPQHLALNAKIIPFAGWEMPVQYASIIEETRAVRRRLGCFDVSHLCRFEVGGREALPFLQKVLTADLSRLKAGRVQYSPMCREDGGIIEDFLVYRLEEDRFILVGNAANEGRDFEWLTYHIKPFKAWINNKTRELAMLALQGPLSPYILDNLCAQEPSHLPRFAVGRTELTDIPVVLSRTGYTGEDGYELMASAGEAGFLWQLLTGAGATPCGLGARDLLRLEAGFLLYGSDIDPEVNPLEAGLGRFVSLSKDFIGREALAKGEVKKRLVGLKMRERGIPRGGYAILYRGERVGAMTSGNASPSLGVGIGLGYVPPALASPGQRLEIDIRGRLAEVEVVPLPFYMVKQGG